MIDIEYRTASIYNSIISAVCSALRHVLQRKIRSTIDCLCQINRALLHSLVPVLYHQVRIDTYSYTLIFAVSPLFRGCCKTLILVRACWQCLRLCTPLWCIYISRIRAPVGHSNPICCLREFVRLLISLKGEFSVLKGW